MEKSGGQRTNNAFRDIALVPAGRQHPTHPNSKPPALIPTLRKRSTESDNKNCRKTTSALEPKTHSKQDQGVKNLAKLSPWFQYTLDRIKYQKLPLKQLLVWSHKTHLFRTKPVGIAKNNNESISQTIAQI